MSGPLKIHRRVKPIYDALQAAGFRLTHGITAEPGVELSKSAELSIDLEATFGVARFIVHFQSGLRASVIDYLLCGDKPGWEICLFNGREQAFLKDAFLPEPWCDDPIIWRFDIEDLDTCMASFEKLALKYGK